MPKSFVSWNPLILDVEPGTSGTMRSVLAVRHNVRSPKVYRFEPFFGIPRAGLAQNS